MRTLKLFCLAASFAACQPDHSLAPPSYGPAGPCDVQGRMLAPPAGDVIPGRYNVVLKREAAPLARMRNPADAAALKMSFESQYQLRIDRFHPTVAIFSAALSAGQLQALRADPRVQGISEEHTVSVALATACLPPIPAEPVLPPTGMIRIRADRTRAAGLTGKGVDVADIDTGSNFVAVGGINCASDGIDYSDLMGHGTHTAHTILDVAPDARIWSVRVLDAGGYGTDASVICGIDYVAQHGPGNGGRIRIANMSLGRYATTPPDDDCGNTNPDAMHTAICRARDAGVTFFVAAGNNGSDTSTFVPAGYDDADITLTALADAEGQPGGKGGPVDDGAGDTYPDDTFTDWSNYGAAVDLGAPGTHILSTWKDGSRIFLSGTSMATPHGTGAGALWLQQNPDATWTDVRDGLRSIAERVGSRHFDPDGRHPEPVLNVGGL